MKTTNGMKPSSKARLLEWTYVVDLIYRAAFIGSADACHRLASVQGWYKARSRIRHSREGVDVWQSISRRLRESRCNVQSYSQYLCPLDSQEDQIGAETRRIDGTSAFKATKSAGDPYE